MPHRERSRPPLHPGHVRPPRGGFWHVSLCVGNDRWRTLNWIGSHAEADYRADAYRRKCRRVAVHREGQPPRERVAPVLPMSYRPPSRDARDTRDARDAETIQKLLADFVRSNDKATAIVLGDALLQEGYDWAAYDLRESVALGCHTRRPLAERILSEVLNGSAVLEHGEWYFPPGQREPQLHPYVLILEREPIHFMPRQRRRRSEPRIVLWSRYGSRPGLCSWRLFGTYDLSEFDSLHEAEETARADIRYEKQRPSQRHLRGGATPRRPFVPGDRVVGDRLGDRLGDEMFGTVIRTDANDSMVTVEWDDGVTNTRHPDGLDLA